MELYDLKKNEIFLVTLKAVIQKDGKYLVLRVSDPNSTSNGLWEFPGGILEMQEGLEQSLVREVEEEAGVLVEIDHLLASADSRYKNFVLKDGRCVNVRFIGLAYKCHIKKGDIRLSEEHDAFQWVTKEEMSKLSLSPSTIFGL